MLSTLIAPDLAHYPDSGKFGVRSAKGERVLLSRPGPLLDYWTARTRPVTWDQASA